MPFPYKPETEEAPQEEHMEAMSGGSGASVSGYVESPISKQCGTCEYLEGDSLCNNETVQQDPELQTDQVSGLKVVNPVTGCCNFWEAGAEDSDASSEQETAQGDVNRGAPSGPVVQPQQEPVGNG